MDQKTRVRFLARLDRLHTAIAEAMPDANGPLRAELEAMEERVMEMRQEAATGEFKNGD